METLVTSLRNNPSLPFVLATEVTAPDGQQARFGELTFALQHAMEASGAGPSH